MIRIRCNRCQATFEVEHLTEPTLACPTCGPVNDWSTVNVVRFNGEQAKLKHLETLPGITVSEEVFESYLSKWRAKRLKANYRKN